MKFKKFKTALMLASALCSMDIHTGSAADVESTIDNVSFNNSSIKDTKIRNINKNEGNFVSNLIKKHPKKTAFLSSLLACYISRKPLNEVRLKIIYKELDEKLHKIDIHGDMNDGVRFVSYRFGGGDELVFKAMRHGTLGHNGFESEKLAYEKINELKKKYPKSEFNRHLANIFDYHYGWNHDYVVYEKAKKSNWYEVIKNKDYNFKLKWYKEFVRQFVGTLKYLDDNGLSHGDPISSNIAISLDENKMPVITFYDYGCFHEKGKIAKTYAALYKNETQKSNLMVNELAYQDLYESFKFKNLLNYIKNIVFFDLPDLLSELDVIRNPELRMKTSFYLSGVGDKSIEQELKSLNNPKVDQLLKKFPELKNKTAEASKKLNNYRNSLSKDASKIEKIIAADPQSVMSVTESYEAILKKTYDAASE